MSVFAKLQSSLRSMFRRGQVEKEMDSELRFHIESYAEDLVRGGISRDEALRRARLEFGGVEVHKEECRESLGLRLWDELRSDLRFAIRALRHSPGFTAIAVTSLALGIGANTAIFTLAQEVLLRSIAVPQPERLRLLQWVQMPNTKVCPCWGNFRKNAAGELVGTPFTYVVYQQMSEHNQVFEELVAFKDIFRLAVNTGAATESLSGELVSGNFYQGLRPRVQLGRGILPDDDKPSASPVAVIGDAYWARHFGRSVDVLGQRIRVNDLMVTIVGVNGPEFRGAKTGGTDLFFPMKLQPAIIPHERGPLLTDAKFSWVVIMGRLKTGVSQQSAQATMNVIFRNAVRSTVPERKEEQIPPLELISGARGLDMQTEMYSKPIFVLMAVAGLVLLIACANLANLLLARAAARHREMSVRLAMGAGKWRIVRQVMTESLLLAGFGGAAGLLLGYTCRGVIPNLFEQSWATTTIVLEFNWQVFVFCLALTLVTGLLFSVVPAWRATQADVNAGLKETSRMTAARHRALATKSLVVFQVSLSVLLLVGAGLFTRTLLNLKSVGIGFNPENIVLFNLDPPRARYSAAQRVDLFRRVEERLSGLPGVQSATLSSDTLLANELDNTCFRPTGRPAKANPRDESVFMNAVGRDFFQTMGIPVVSGRAFSSLDTQRSPKTAVINQTLARTFFPHENPLGQTFGFCEGKSEPVEIVGISADAKYNSLREAVRPTLYLPYLQADDAGWMTFEIKTPASTASMVPELSKAVSSIDKDLPLIEIRTQLQQINATISGERVFATLTTTFGLLALLLACIGIYGIMAYAVARRTSEIGIRMALGARAREVLTMILKEASVLAIIGVVVGIGAALSATRLIASLLFGLKPTDPLTLMGAGALLLALALVAGFAPAFRASRVDPMHALRHE